MEVSRSFRSRRDKTNQTNTGKNSKDTNLVLELLEGLISELPVSDGQHEVGDGRELVELEVEPFSQGGNPLVDRRGTRVVQSLD